MANEITVVTTKAFKEYLGDAIEGLRKTLPVAHQHQAERFIQRAILTFQGHEQKEKVSKCTLLSLTRCVFEAAECGFALDGKFVYLIPYGTDAQCEFDFKAIVAMARRAGAVEDCRPQVVCDKDEFDYWDEAGKVHYRFREARGDRGPIIGAYAVAVFPTGNFRFTYMALSELKKVRSVSKSPNSPAWVKWEDQMFCKAVIKRCLKGLLDDPGLVRMLEIDDANYSSDIVDGKVHGASPKRMQSNDSLADELERRAAISFVPEEADFAALVTDYQSKINATGRTAGLVALKTTIVEDSLLPKAESKMLIDDIDDKLSIINSEAEVATA